jgi:hypothetical protein
MLEPTAPPILAIINDKAMPQARFELGARLFAIHDTTVMTPG